MKFSKILSLVILAIALAIVPRASAQLGVDTFHPTRNLAIGVPFYMNGPAVTVVTNGPVDLVDFGGFSALTFFCNTNASSVQSTVQIYTSVDKTNWVNLSNYALVSGPTSFVITNYYGGGTNLFITNSSYLPGTVVTPNAATALFGTPYIAYSPATNIATTITLNGAGLTIVGFQKTDSSRYLEYSIVPAAGGSGTNVSGFGWYTGYPQNPQGD